MRGSTTVVEPQCIITPSATGGGTFSPGDVCMGTLRTVNDIGPLTVSFRGVKVFEVPCMNAIPPTGYFATAEAYGTRPVLFDSTEWDDLTGMPRRRVSRAGRVAEWVRGDLRYDVYGAGMMVTNCYDAATGWLDASRSADGTWVEYTRSDGGAVASATSI